MMIRRSFKILYAAMVLCLAVLIAVAYANCRVIYECNAEFVYVDRGRRPFNEPTDEWTREYSVRAAQECADRMFSEKNLRELADAFAKDFSLDDEAARRIEETVRGVKFAVVERPTTNFEVRCRISLSADKPDHLSEALDRCLGLYRSFIDIENEVRLGRAAFNEHQAWCKCKRQIEELERMACDGRDVEEQLDVAFATLSALADKKAAALKAASLHGLLEMANVVVHPPKRRLKWK